MHTLEQIANLRKMVYDAEGSNYPPIYSGDRKESLTVLGRAPSRKKQGTKTYIPYLEVRCDCGKVYEINVPNFRTAKQCRSCSSRTASSFKTIKGVVFANYRAGAEKRGLRFDITPEEMYFMWEAQGKVCALSGAPINWKNGTASVDRIDSSKGYTVSNIQIVHKDINLMKRDFDEEYFVDLCKKVADRAYS